jgi:hypothetical protein
MASSLIRVRSPSPVCSIVCRTTCRPRPSTTATAWSSRAQSMPPVTSLTGWSGRTISGRLHVNVSLLAASPSGEAPVCGAGTRQPVRSLIGARRRSALSTVGTPRATARPRISHTGRQTRRASTAVARRHHGCINVLSENADNTMVHQ